MLKRRLVTLAAGVGWAVMVLDIAGVPAGGPSEGVARMGGYVAIVCTLQLMLWTRHRPVAQAFDLGYQKGRRDQMREANARPLSPIRRAAGGVSQFNRDHIATRPASLNGSRLDA